jgi:DNA-binding transcriptional ArsR family regulator
MSKVKRKTAKKVTPEMLGRMKAMLGKGATAYRIAKDLKLTPSVASYHLKKMSTPVSSTAANKAVRIIDTFPKESAMYRLDKEISEIEVKLEQYKNARSILMELND